MKNKQAKRHIMVLLLAAILIISIAVPVAHAAGTAEIAFGQVSGKCGEQVTVPVTIKNNPGIASFRFRIAYDSTALIYVSAAKGEAMTGGTLSVSYQIKDEELAITWFDVKNISGDGVIFNLVFEGSEIANGRYPLTVSYLPEDIVNASWQQIDFTVSDGWVQTAFEHNYIPFTTQPTCTKDGYTTYTCSRCDDSYVVDYVDATGHSYDAGVVTTKPTCTEEGVKTFTCTACGDSYTESVSALGHNYDSRVKLPTCTKEGYTTYTCSRCDDSYIADYVPATGHSYDAGVVTTKPTCTEEGVKTFTCTACGDAYREPVSALGHDPQNHTAQAATCTDIGWEAYVTCSRCDYSTYQEIGATGHKYQGVVTEPTCTAEGYTTYTCSGCGDSYRADAVAATGHSHIGVITTEPTCTEKGVKTFTCSACGDAYTEPVPALGHDPQNHTAQAATCTDIGWEAYVTCSRCDYSTYQEIGATGHKYQGVVTEPTCTEDGYTTYTCVNCEDSYRADTVSATGHSHIGVITTEPTCTEEGIKTFTCSACGDAYTEPVSALGHNYVEGICQQCNGEDPDYIPPVSGDVNCDGVVDNLDVEYLLWHTLFPEEYLITVNADYDANGVIDNLDVEALLWFTLFPEEYPLVKKEEEVPA